MKQEFKPTPEQITACTKLVVSMAFEGMAKEEFKKIEAEVLSERNFYFDDHYYTDEKGISLAKRCNFPDDKIIRRSQDTCHMAGLKDLQTENYPGSDSDIFYSMIREKAYNKGFCKGENFDAIACNNRHKFENAFIDITDNIHHLGAVNLYGEHRKKLLDLMLNLFVPLMTKEEKDRISLEYYRENIKIGTAVKQAVNEFLESI
jgi:hypothetical protein